MNRFRLHHAALMSTCFVMASHANAQVFTILDETETMDASPDVSGVGTADATLTASVACRTVEATGFAESVIQADVATSDVFASTAGYELLFQLGQRSVLILSGEIEAIEFDTGGCFFGIHTTTLKLEAGMTTLVEQSQLSETNIEGTTGPVVISSMLVLEPGEYLFSVVADGDQSGPSLPDCGGWSRGTFDVSLEFLCKGDGNMDGSVNFADVTSILFNWLSDYTGTVLGTGHGDSNFDGVVTFADVTATLSNWLCCP